MKSVLILEDHPDSAAALALSLGRCGVPSVIAGTGTEAMRFFWSAVDEGEPYGVIVADCAVPRLSGWNVVANVRRAEGDVADLARAFVIGYTGYQEQAAAFISEQDFSMFDRMFTKPADPAELITLVERVAKGECVD